MCKTKSKIIGKFYALTYDNQIYEFYVDENNLIYCEQIAKKREIISLVINPNFKAYINDTDFISCNMLAKEKGNKTGYHLIGSYLIPNDLLEKLTTKKIILYNTEMGYLYGLNPEYAYDKKEQTSSFKRIKRKNTEILLK